MSRKGPMVKPHAGDKSIPQRRAKAKIGIQYVLDEKDRKVAVQIDLKKYRDLWEDIEDVLVSQSRQGEKRIPLEKSESGPGEERQARG
jgi:hypothetical protein